MEIGQSLLGIIGCSFMIINVIRKADMVVDRRPRATESRVINRSDIPEAAHVFIRAAFDVDSVCATPGLRTGIQIFSSNFYSQYARPRGRRGVLYNVGSR